MTIGLEEINRLDQTYFTELLGGIFEHSPWVAQSSYAHRPFTSIGHLHRVLVEVVRGAPPEKRAKLLCSHPELAGKEAETGDLTGDSRREQAGAGLNQCSADELADIKSLNRAYRGKFQFPFIIAVTGLGKQQIIAAMRKRLGHNLETELKTAHAEVEKIALIRLKATIDE